ncbi:MAG TPA: FAD-binding oxidoreductase [Chitinophagaceae bacterium]|nr:FAD-binding oxidoreductase [Chitinophagaceae bacterium]
MALSVWEREVYYNHKQVVIVGAGLAGLWSAIELKRRNSQLKILMLEKGVIPGGASTRNAGFACFGSPTELLHDAGTIGAENMLTITEMRYKGINKIRSFFGDKAIEFDPCYGYELLDDKYNNAGELDDKLAWLNKQLQLITGQEQTFLRDNKKLKQFNFNNLKNLIENKLEGGLHSGKLVQLLTRYARDRGVEIMTGMEVKGYTKSGNIVHVHVSNNEDITCDKLLISINGFTSNLIKNTPITPARGQVLLTAPIPSLPFSGTFHADEGFYYFRNLGDRVLLGGARNKAFQEEATTQEGITTLIQSELEQFLKEKILPGRLFTIENRWSGIMGFTSSKQPVAEEVEPGIFMLIACNGMGVALTPVMAEKMATLMLE